MDPLIGLTISFDTPLASTKNDEEAPRGGTGSQVLPVADLDQDYDGVPQDGLEYLFMVRKEASTHPDINRAANYTSPVVLPSVPHLVHIPTDRPTDAWLNDFLLKFNKVRKRISNLPVRSSFPTPIHELPPASDDDEGWRIYIYGERKGDDEDEEEDLILPDAAPAPPPPTTPATSTSWIEEMEARMIGLNDAEALEAAKAIALASLELDAPPLEPPSPSTFLPLDLHPLALTSQPVSSDLNEAVYRTLPHLPSPSLLLDLPSPLLLALLELFTDWFTDRLATYPHLNRTRSSHANLVPSLHEITWLLSLLSKLDALQSGDEISVLRCLSKTLMDISAVSERESKREEERVGKSKKEREEDEERAEARAGCWMVVAVVAGVWGQWDLWRGDN